MSAVAGAATASPSDGITFLVPTSTVTVVLFTILVVVLSLGLGNFLWGTIGLIRVGTESVQRLLARRRGAHDRRRMAGHVPLPLFARRTAVVIPAHNEERVIARTIESVTRLIPRENVHVISDGSSDATADIARAHDVNVYERTPAGGKASALVTALDRFDILQRFDYVLFLDADTVVGDGYLRHAEPLLRDPEVVAVAGYAESEWHPRETSTVGNLLIAHRERVYLTTQVFVKYGQTAKWANVTPIVPGFASMYRTSVLPCIDIAAPGLIIEDFNMTFELHHRRLGKIGFVPGASAYTQDPDRFGDYVKQVSRWSLGFWQTVRRHGFWWSGFSAALALLVGELLLSSILMLLVPLYILANLLASLFGTHMPLIESPIPTVFSQQMTLRLLLLAFIVPDYLVTCFCAVVQRQPRFLVYGLASIPLRIVDAAIALRSLVRAWRATSTGTWVSPARR